MRPDQVHPALFRRGAAALLDDARPRRGGMRIEQGRLGYSKGVSPAASRFKNNVG